MDTNKKYLIAVPCINSTPVDFITSLLGLQRIPNSNIAFTQGSLVYDARNRLADSAIDGGFDRMLWLDSDMIFEPDLMVHMAEEMDKNGYEYLSGLYFKRTMPTEPVCYENLVHEVGEKGVHIECTPMLDYPKNQIFECAGTGFGAVMIDVALIKDVKAKYGLPFSPMLGFGEDLTFNWRVKQLGRKMYCDSRIKLGHLAQIPITEEDYILQQHSNG